MAKLCEENDLNVNIESAGIFAQEGSPATPEAVEALKKYDIDISSHRAQPITQELIDKSDLILTMTEAHKMLLQGLAKDKTCTVCELADIDSEISDPFGSDLSEYEKTADNLYIALSQIADKLYMIEQNKKEEGK